MTDETPVAAADPTVDTSSLLKCYGMLALAVPMTFSTFTGLSMVGVALLIAGIAWNRRMRKTREGALFENHTRWIKRTFWISALFTLFATTICWMIFTSHADSTGLTEMVQGMQDGTATPESVQATIDAFYANNARLMLWDWIGCFTPVVLHAVVRYLKGYLLADAGKPIPNVTTWWL